METLAKTDFGSSTHALESNEGKSAGIVSEQDQIKECPPAPFIRYGCLGCLNSWPVAGHCLFGNEVGDEYCLKERRLNLRATQECVRKGCLSAIYVENRTLVCAHNELKCECIDTLGNSYGDLQKARPLAFVFTTKARKHPSGALIEEVPC